VWTIKNAPRPVAHNHFLKNVLKENMSEKSFKEALLKSGLPLEYEVNTFLKSLNFISDFEYSYLKYDENNIEKEFSYDISASLIKDPHYLDFMIECKYKVENTNWVFLPEDRGGPNEIYPLDFIHVIDHFSKTKSPVYNDYIYPELCPPCTKGIELYGNGNNNDKTIEQAVSQLSSAFAEKIADAFMHQIEELMVHEMIFYQIPVIVTTANLYRLKENITIKEIKESDNFETIADHTDILMYRVINGPLIQNRNVEILSTYLQSISQEKLKDRFHCFTNDMDHLAQVLAKFPISIIILHWDENHDSFKRLIKYVCNTIEPDEETLSILKRNIEEREIKINEIEQLLLKKKKEHKEKTS
jgi:hypothetical protein